MSEAFNPDYLRQHLRPLAAAEADAAVLAYQAYYGLDLRSRHPRLQARLGSMAVDGRRLAVQAWLLPEARGSLLLMHGYYDHMGLYRHVVDWALGMGFSVLACDLPGHGLSEGERASIRDFAEYQAVFKGLLGQAAELDLAAPWHLCGQSTGGAILLDYLLHGGERPELGETILLAPLVRPRAWGWSKLSYRLLSPFVDSIPRRFSENSSDPQFLDFLREHDPLQPRTLPTAWVGALTRWVPRIERAPRRALSPLVVHRQAGFQRGQGRLVVAAAGRRLGEVHVLGEFRIGEIAVDIQQGVLQVRADLLHQALALAFQQLAGLSAAKQAGEARKHLAEAVGGDPGQGQADFRAGLSGRKDLGQALHQGPAWLAGGLPRQAVAVLEQLVAAGGEHLGGDHLAPQRRLEEIQRAGAVRQVLAQAVEGALVDFGRGEAAIAVVHQGLVERGRQLVLVALLRRVQGIAEMRALVGPASGLVQALIRVGQGGQTNQQ